MNVKSIAIVVGVFACAALSVPQPRPEIRFHNVATEAGLDFTLENSPTPEKRMIETMPGGIAVFDYDSDGRPDIFFTNGASVPSLQKSSPRFYNRLFHNEGGWKFRDVTAAAGLAGEGYSMGAAAADFDNDGNVDLFVTGVHHNILYRNLGNGHFEDVTAKSGIKSNEWSVAAGWFDFDNDGLLDLFVVNYGAWPPSTDRFCGDASRGLRIYCHPKYFDPRPNQIYRNRGNGTFEDITAKSGVGQHLGRGMSVAFADYDSDGLMDIFVTNDNLPNFLFYNAGQGKFEETALLAGVALLDHGKPVASMGADFRDYDNDGHPDIALTALNGETFPLFHNDGRGAFHDATHTSMMARLSLGRSGWAAGFVDFNNDGFKDLFPANSHVNDLVEQVEAAVYKQPNSVFTNTGGGKFELAPDPELAASARAHRGAAFADFDGDGRIDVVVSALGERAELWRNTSAGAGHWLVLKLRGTKSNRDGIGAVVKIGSQVNHMTSACGYASSSHTGVHFGLGAQSRVRAIEIRWPSGRTQTLKDVAADQVLAVTEP
jgi:enediyne biosynthesis protein E4